MISDLNENLVIMFLGFVVIFYQSSQGAGIWSYLSEIGNEVSLGISMLALNFTSIALGIPFFTMINDWGIEVVFIVFGGINVFNSLVLFVIMKETKGLSYE